jgi:flagellar motor protein MotB
MSADQNTFVMGDEGAGYLISVSDLMAGLLFVFIITLMAFVINYQRAAEQADAAEVELKSESKQTAAERDRLKAESKQTAAERDRLKAESKQTAAERDRLKAERDRLQLERDRLNAVVDDLTNAKRLRVEMLERIQRELVALGIRVEVDTEHGILHLTEDAVQFPSGRAELTDKEDRKLSRIGDVLSEVLPCYAAGASSAVGCEPHKAGKLESVFIEGHTDNVPYTRSGRFDDNWDLSAQRAMYTYRTMIVGNDGLSGMRNGDGFPVFSVSGYGEGRPRNKYDEPTPDAANRRIDLRFIMSPPRADVAPVAELKGSGL